MGSYTYGSLAVNLSRPFTTAEKERFIEWAHRLAVNELDGDFDPKSNATGDIGVLDVRNQVIYFETDGKVYDIADKVEKILAGIPPNISLSGENIFETEGEHWALRVTGRKVEELDAELRIVDPEADRVVIYWDRVNGTFEVGGETRNRIIIAEAGEGEVVFDSQLPMHRPTP